MKSAYDEFRDTKLFLKKKKLLETAISGIVNQTPIYHQITFGHRGFDGFINVYRDLITVVTWEFATENPIKEKRVFASPETARRFIELMFVKNNPIAAKLEPAYV